MALVKDPSNIRLAMLGMVDGNGHPYSWSAIINGRYEPEAMGRCGYASIPQYLGAAPAGALGIPGAQVTHVWCEDADQAANVAKAAYVANVVRDPLDVIGQVDAVIIPTDKGHEHVARARPFIEAGLPVFVDKPMVDNATDLRQFIQWHKAGKAILSTSCMRYAREFDDIRRRLGEVGQVRLITMTTAKSWERYGIHALEGAYPLLAPGGYVSVANSGTEKAAIVHVRHEGGAEMVLAAIDDLYGAFGCLGVYGTAGHLQTKFADTLYAFKTQLEAFVQYLRTGRPPVPFEQTVELMTIIIAGIESRRQGGRRILLKEVLQG